MANQIEYSGSKWGINHFHKMAYGWNYGYEINDSRTQIRYFRYFTNGWKNNPNEYTKWIVLDSAAIPTDYHDCENRYDNLA